MLKNHKFKDQDIEGVTIDDDETIELLIDKGVEAIILSKDDALAMARHFGLFDSDVLVNEM